MGGPCSMDLGISAMVKGDRTVRGSFSGMFVMEPEKSELGTSMHSTVKTGMVPDLLYASFPQIREFACKATYHGVKLLCAVAHQHGL